jgi:hypothetical protein
MSLNDSVTFHESLAAPHPHGGHHHGGGGGGHRVRFRRLIDPAYYDQGYPYYYGPEYGSTRSVDDEVAFHEAKHDVIAIESPGHKQQVRQAVVDALKARGWVESTKDGARLLSPPGFVAVMKGLGMIHGLGEIAAPETLNPVEMMGLGVGGLMFVGGVVVEGMIGKAMMVLGGGTILFSGGAAILRHLSTASQAQSSAAAAVQQQALPPGATVITTPTGQQQVVYAQPPPPPPPPKLTSSQRLQQSVQAYGPLAGELIKGLISIF